MSPHLMHNCDVCQFLGDYVHTGEISELNGTYDLYFCPKGPMPTVIARYGNSGPDYLSGRPIAEALRNVQPDHPLVVALKRAEEGKLVQPPGSIEVPEGVTASSDEEFELETPEPCPFCGPRGKLEHFPKAMNPNGGQWYVACRWCLARGPIANSRARAVEEWNKRSKG